MNAIKNYLGQDWRRHWARVLTLVLAIGLLLVAPLWLVGTLPGTPSVVYPAWSLYWALAEVVFWPAFGLLMLGIVLFIPYFVTTNISKVDGNAGVTYDPPDMRGLVVLIGVAALGYALCFPAISAPETIASATTNNHRYHLLVEPYSDTLDRFYLYTCDAGGLLCEPTLTEISGGDNGWSRTVALNANGATLRIENRGRLLQIIRDSERE
jgi:hypothetical protein